MLFGTLATSLSGSALASEGVLRAGEGVLRVGERTNKQYRVFNAVSSFK